jgi:prevent-host-death family protein
MAISKFKATCLAVLERVRKTGKPIRVTRFGEPIAEVVPPGRPERSEDWVGSMAGTARIVGDIVGPSSDLVEWGTERE